MDETITTGPQAEPENPPDQPGQRRFLLWHRLSLGGILLIAVFMDFFQLGANGFGSYYPPAVRSMMDNWHNFFFAAYDPGAFVTIDKPPVGFWLQVASAKIFGFNAVSILAPQALAGVLSVLLLYYLVRRHFGVTAGLLAALALALSPISVVTNRNITIDSTLALTLLVGAWAVLRAAETGKLRWLLLSALIVGIGFNIKMLEAYLVVPAYAVLYLVTAPRSIWVRIGHLSLAGLLLVVVSLSWVVAVDLTPTSQRPYVDSTQDNSEISLAFGYNGLERLLGMGGPSGTKGGPTTIQGNATQQPQPSGGTPVGIFVTSAIGPLRLFEVQIGSQAGWLLPLALLGMLALAWQPRQNVREDRKFQSLVFWGTWLLTMGIYFSVASGILHQWYLTVMAPAIAAFFGIGLVTMWQDYRRGGWRGWLLPVALAATAAEQIYLLSDYPTWGRWMIPLIAALGIVVIVALVGTRISRQLRDKAPNIRFLLPALGIGVVALLFAPTVWAVTPIFLSTQADTLLAGPPQTGDNGGGGFVISTGSQTFTGTLPGKVGGNTATNNDALIRYLEANQGNAKFLVAVPNSQGIGDQIILATNKPVMSLGGFSNDPILTTGQLAALVKNGTVRFFLLQSVGLPQQILNQIPEQYRDQLQGGPGPNSALSTWVTQHCKTVPASLWQSTSTGSTSGGGSGNGNGNQLYDCATTH
ncbi:MAG TPA: glycosyltransferase family 39 protein [Ktedonobacteraceae bacterium]|nr:glycosyltransferase family 39 protein [Ktedonobacteraceae bacterium]